MKWMIAALLTLSVVSVRAADEKINMNVQKGELLNLIETYSKATGQKFIVDPSVRGMISILTPEPVSAEEAFNQLSSALAVNGFAISKQGDTMVVKAARNVQRDLIEVSSERPSLKPERMYSWVYTFKNISAAEVNRDLRILPSRDGEMNVYMRNNQVIITDWTSNLNRLAELFKVIDKPADPMTVKLVAAEQKNMKKESSAAKKEEKKAKTEQ